MFPHPSIHGEIAHQLHRDLLATAERQRIAKAASAGTRVDQCPMVERPAEPVRVGATDERSPAAKVGMNRVGSPAGHASMTCVERVQERARTLVAQGQALREREADRDELDSVDVAHDLAADATFQQCVK
jgi:hypothetical protein